MSPSAMESPSDKGEVLKSLPAASQVLSVEVSPEERESGIPSAATIGAAISILQRDGIVVINGVVDHDHIDTLNTILTDEAETLASMEGTHFNLNADSRNISQVQYVNGNTALRGGTRQYVHADIDFKHLSFPFGIVANYYLTDTGPANGSTEVWVGSHRNTLIEDNVDPSEPKIRPVLLEKRRAVVPPIQPIVKKGSVVLQDLRLWHAGMPNHSDTPRIMLSFVRFSWWYENTLRVPLPASSKPLVQRLQKDRGITYEADFVDGHVDHMNAAFTATFGAGNPHVVY